MSSIEPTTDEYREFLAYRASQDRLAPDWEERKVAKLSGWDPGTYQVLYHCYIESTQMPIVDDASKAAKGKALEELGRYLLEKSGFATGEVRELRIRSQFQVDGHGSLNTSAAWMIFGEEDQRKFFPDFYFEAKNHIQSMDGEQFGHHCDRMRRAAVRCGVCLSTAGYGIGNRQGYNEDLYYDWRDGVVHLLLNMDDLKALSKRAHPPLVSFRQAYQRVKTRQYQTKAVWERYSASYGLRVAAEEYQRLKSASQAVTGQGGSLP